MHRLVTAVVVAVAVVLAGVAPAHARQASAFGSIGGGISITPEADDPGVPLISPGVGGNGPAVAVDVGVWSTVRFGFAAEASVGLPFQVRQREGGFGICCSALTRDHRLTFVSAVAKARPANGFVVLAGLGIRQVSTDEVRVFTPLGGTPRAPVESSFSKSQGTWLVGVEGELRLSRSLRLVPALRLYRVFGEDDLAERNPLALGRSTARLTLSLRGAGGQ